MKFNQLTYHISIVILVITALYTLVYAGLTGLLLTSAITLLAAAFMDDFEVVAAVTVIFALFYTMFLKRYLQRLEPFTDKEIIKRVKDMEVQYHPQKQNMNMETSQPAAIIHRSRALRHYPILQRVSLAQALQHPQKRAMQFPPRKRKK